MTIPPMGTVNKELQKRGDIDVYCISIFYQIDVLAFICNDMPNTLNRIFLISRHLSYFRWSRQLGLFGNYSKLGSYNNFEGSHVSYDF